MIGNPPRGFITLVRVQGLDEARVKARAEALAGFLRQGVERIRSGAEEDGDGPPSAMLLGPMPSPIAKINRRVRWQLLIRARRRGPLRWLLGHLRQHLGPEGNGAAQTLAVADVDPQSLL